MGASTPPVQELHWGNPPMHLYELYSHDQLSVLAIAAQEQGWGYAERNARRLLEEVLRGRRSSQTGWRD